MHRFKTFRFWWLVTTVYFLAFDGVGNPYDEYLTLVEIGQLPDDHYAQITGYDRHGRVVIREGEAEDDREPYFPGAGRSWDDHAYGAGGDSAGTGGSYD